MTRLDEIRARWPAGQYHAFVPGPWRHAPADIAWLLAEVERLRVGLGMVAMCDETLERVKLAKAVREGDDWLKGGGNG